MNPIQGATLQQNSKAFPSFGLLLFQSHSKQRLDEILEHYQKFLSKRSLEDPKDFQDLVNFTNTRLLQICLNEASSDEISKYRVAIVASSAEEVEKIISSKTYMKDESKTTLDNSLRICFLFTGQGSQYPGMARKLYELSPIFQINFDRCCKILEETYEIDIRGAMWDNPVNKELSRTLYSQTSIFVVEYCLLKLYESLGVQIGEGDCVLGHSLGEFCAALAAGYLDLEDALKLVAERSKLIDSLQRGKMLVVRSDLDTVEEHLKEFSRNNPGASLDIAAINSKEQTVLSGDTLNVERFSEFCQNRKLKTIVLEATHAFHSRRMDPILEAYREVAKTCKGPASGTKIIYVSGMEGSRKMDLLDSDYWVRHTREPVRFVDACKVAYKELGCTLFLEIGPQPILSALVKANIGNAEKNYEGEKVPMEFLPSIRRGGDDWKVLLNSLGKLWVMGRNFDIDKNSTILDKSEGEILTNADVILKEILMG